MRGGVRALRRLVSWWDWYLCIFDLVWSIGNIEVVCHGEDSVVTIQSSRIMEKMYRMSEDERGAVIERWKELK